MSRTKQCIGAIDCNEPVERTKDGKPRPRCEKHRKEHAQGLLASMARIDPDIAASLGLAVEEDDLYPTLDEIGVWFFDHQPIQVALDAWKVALAQHDAELRKEIAWEIRAMGSESWDGYTPDEVPGTVAARIAEAPDA